MTTVYMTPAMLAQADRIGRLRQFLSNDRGAVIRIKNDLCYDAAMALNIHGARCELAAFYFFCGLLPWYDYDEHYDPHRADLGTRVEVKGRKLHRHRLMVSCKDLKRGRVYVSVCSEDTPHFTIEGWLYGDEVANGEIFRGEDGNAYRVENNILRKPIDLLVMVRRQAQRCA